MGPGVKINPMSLFNPQDNMNKNSYTDVMLYTEFFIPKFIVKENVKENEKTLDNNTRI